MPLAFEAVGLGNPYIFVVGILCQREAEALVGVGISLVFDIVINDVEQVVRLEVFAQRYFLQTLLVARKCFVEIVFHKNRVGRITPVRLFRANLRFSYEIASKSRRCTIYFDDNGDNIRQHRIEKVLCCYDDNGDNGARFTCPPCGIIVAPKRVMGEAGCKPKCCA